MSIGWKEIDGQWYYLYSSGNIAKNTTINGYKLGSDGALIQTTQTTQNSLEQGDLTLNDISRKYIVEYPTIPMPSNVNPNATTIAGVTGVKFDYITKIVFRDGRGGLIKRLITVNDKQKIKEFMGYLDGYSIKKVEDPHLCGWVHATEFYINDKKVMDITFVDPIEINCEYFNITQGDLDSKTFDKFLKSVDQSYIMMDEYDAYFHSH